MAVLHKAEQDLAVNETKISETDRKIAEYIAECTDGDFTEKINEDSNWQVFFQLSSLREGLYCWYEFRPEARLLEVGAGFGPLTGLFTRRCKSVTATERSAFRASCLQQRYQDRENLEIYSGDIGNLSFPEKFDYIVLTGLLERAEGGSSDRQRYVEYLQEIKKWLKEDGTLLLAVENRFGLKYICGAEEPHTGKAFDGLNKYPRGTRGYSFSREEIADIVSRAGFPVHRFYYPLPDYKVPQMVYSDEYLPKTRVSERLVPYYTHQDSLVAVEKNLYDDVVENGVFPFFANSFFLECGRTGSINFATVTPDRGRARAMSTVIHNNGKVEKCPVFPEGKENIRKQFEHLEELQRRNIPTIEATLLTQEQRKNVLEMPYREELLASAYLKKELDNPDFSVPQFFEKLYGHILRSSTHVTDTDELFGVILEKAYIEMIPMNAFWAEGDFLFFDQEFVYENYPAKYVLYRALRNTYLFIPETGERFSLQQAKEYFDMDEIWHRLEEMDNKFLQSVRRLEENKTFYSWTRIHADRIYRKAELLNHKDELIADYKVPHKMKQIWEIQLKILKKFQEVCTSHNLRFYMIRGTLLGAVRHKGHIPWDDDVDVAMPREDYNRLLALMPEVFGPDHMLQTAGNEGECFFGLFARLRDCNSTALDLKNWGRKCNQGIWIDIFPLDAYDRNPDYRKKKAIRIQRYYNLLQARAYGPEWGNAYEHSWAERRLYYWLSKRYRQEQLFEKVNEICSKCKDPDPAMLGIFTHFAEAKRFYAADFDHTVMLDFAGMKLPAPAGYERCLEMSVGKNYMEYPPVEERKPHHQGLFIPGLPYEVFHKRYTDSFADAKGKTIILFGAGLMVEDYMKKHGKKYPPAFLADNDSKKWGTKKCGLEVRNPEEILRVPEEMRKVFICNVYYKQIEEQFRKMGIRDYCIYVQDKDWILEDEEKEK